MLTNGESLRGKLGHQIGLAGLGIYVVFAPHSVAASAIGVAIGGTGWLIVGRGGGFWCVIGQIYSRAAKSGAAILRC